MFGFLLNTIILFFVELIIIAVSAKSRVQLKVVTKDFILGNSLFAFTANQVSVLAMDIKMLLLVRCLAEGHSTTFYWTNVGFLQSVGTEMVEKIVPLSKIHTTVLLVTGVYI